MKNLLKNPKSYVSAETGKVYESYTGEARNVADAPVSAKLAKIMIQKEAAEYLRTILKPNDKIKTILRHISASGMSRSISAVIAGNNGEIIKLDYWIIRAMGEKFDDKNGGIKCTGCGMDMGFNLVYQLGATLWPNGTDTPHGTRNCAPDSSGGYALKHEWI